MDGFSDRGSTPLASTMKKDLLLQVLFQMKRTLRCMNNEAGLRPMKNVVHIRKISALHVVQQRFIK